MNPSNIHGGDNGFQNYTFIAEQGEWWSKACQLWSGGGFNNILAPLHCHLYSHLFIFLSFQFLIFPIIFSLYQAKLKSVLLGWVEK